MLEEKIKNYLKDYENILFAVIFGSYSSGRFTQSSDLDIGIYTDEGIDLIKFGIIITNLEKITGLNVDLIELNNLFNKSPLLAFQIVTNHKVILLRDEEALINFKRNSYLHYFDTQELRKNINSAFYSRVTEKKFGKRNYA